MQIPERHHADKLDDKALVLKRSSASCASAVSAIAMPPIQHRKNAATPIELPDPRFVQLRCLRAQAQKLMAVLMAEFGIRLENPLTDHVLTEELDGHRFRQHPGNYRRCGAPSTVTPLSTTLAGTF